MRLDKIHFKGEIRYLLLSCVLVMGLISIIASGGGDGDSADAGAGTGTLSISMTDSVTDDLSEVWVTIEEVSVHESVDEENAGENQDNGENEGDDTASWETLEGEGIPGTYNLLELVNGVFQQLGEVTLEAGHYTQIRLILGGEEGDNYVVTKDDPPQELELQISSQDETGIKLTKGFDIESGVVTELILDWDADKSITEIANGEYKMQPTIKILDVEVASTLSGTVTTDDPEDDDPEVTIPVQGALVTATGVETESGESVEVSTFTGEDGGYTLILEEGTYDIVVSKEGYNDASKEGLEIGSATDITSGGDFTLTTLEEA